MALELLRLGSCRQLLYRRVKLVHVPVQRQRRFTSSTGSALPGVSRLPILGSFWAQQPKSASPLICSATIVHENTSAKEALNILSQEPEAVLLYQGKYGQGQALMSAIQRRIRRQRPSQPSGKKSTVTEQWHAYRARQAWQAASLNRVLVQVQPPSFALPHIQHAPPHVAAVLAQAMEESHLDNDNNNNNQPFLISWREILARVAAAEWQRKGVWIAALGDYLHPHFDVYPPTRQEYLALLPTTTIMLAKDNSKDNQECAAEHKMLWDVGTGTGVLTAILLQRHANWTALATDISPLAVACARDNFQRLGLADRVQVQQVDLFPTRINDDENNNHHPQADVIVCNPPWIPATDSQSMGASWLDRAIYDENDTMLRQFLHRVALHLSNKHDSQVWLIVSDLAEHLQLRTRDQLHAWIAEGGLEIVETKKATAQPTRAKKSKRQEMEDQFFPKVVQARQAETTYLFQLRKRAA